MNTQQMTQSEFNFISEALELFRKLSAQKQANVIEDMKLLAERIESR